MPGGWGFEGLSTVLWPLNPQIEITIPWTSCDVAASDSKEQELATLTDFMDKLEKFALRQG